MTSPASAAVDTFTVSVDPATVEPGGTATLTGTVEGRSADGAATASLEITITAIDAGISADQSTVTIDLTDQRDDEGDFAVTFTIELTADADAAEGDYGVDLLADESTTEGNATASGVVTVAAPDTNDVDDDLDEFTENEGDCDDADATVFPEAPELDDDIDNDCDELVDEGLDTTDDDGDGESEVDGDCDDANDAINTGAEEVDDNVDNDCDELIDEGVNDQDGDEVLDADDNCPEVANPGQENNDGGAGDACDANDDNDAELDANDNCQFVANDDQADFNEDGVGDACDDSDMDGIGDDEDNCPTVANNNQADEDEDGLGDACEADADDDGVDDNDDNCPNAANPNQEDADDDGVGDACEAAVVETSDVNFTVTSADPDVVNSLTSQATLEVTQDGEVVCSGQIRSQTTNLPLKTGCTPELAFGTATVKITGDPNFDAFSAEITVDEAPTQEESIELEPSLTAVIAALIEILIDILEDILAEE